MGTHRHTTGDIDPMAKAWHIKRRLREQGRISVKAWALWATKYVAQQDSSPWRDYCQREISRITGADLDRRASSARQEALERVFTAALSKD